MKRSVEDLLNFGVVIIDKPKGPTSHQVSAWVRDILHINKTGHAGTLDPKVTGVLPVGLGRATKLINLLHLVPKEYVGVMRFHKDFDENKVREIMKEFEGEIYQVPPLRSAVARRLRKRKVYSIEILDLLDRDVLFRAKVESGTYIRTLCNDIGEAMCIGAHMEDLRRTATGHFREEDAHTLQDLLDAYIFWKENGEEKYIRDIIRPAEDIVSFLPKIIVKDSAVNALAHGAPLYKPGVTEMDNVEKGNYVALYTSDGELISVSIVVLEDNIIAKPFRVVMEPKKF
ncbi:TPA: RNA-guided pseudouridylation complex pseudouridine synthase subunit Cbf5 [Candidatus Aciduliprofundum boonei]|nr:RNA-guided pseudouridylation complex pseudouridine synthase subunit Cbf5 [Candidatus Aciduliprofundum boonei]EDY35903.1 TruB family pseudouridylate synthase (N terminal domain) protein [Aciduliprofundum boonei T469]HII55231.1 RNA-guided pseudouridylation complex pseudouridine synthase subunit Cbf5 [Candidatus Aciduliprofundum boonei]